MTPATSLDRVYEAGSSHFVFNARVGTHASQGARINCVYLLRPIDGVVIVVHRSGFVMANAGIDFSNVDAGAPDESAGSPGVMAAWAAALLPHPADSDPLPVALLGALVSGIQAHPWAAEVVRRCLPESKRLRCRGRN